MSGSSFVISSADSFLCPVANADVFVEIDSSLRKLEFNDYIKTGVDANVVSMLAYKFQDTFEESYGSLVLDNDTYSVSCLSYSDSWVLVEASGDDIRQSIEKVSGSGADGNLAFSVEAFVDTSDQSDSSDSITVLVELVNSKTEEQFKTVNPDGAVSTIIFNVNSDLTMDAEFSRPDEVSGSMNASVTQSSIE